MIEKMILALSLFLTGGTHVESDNNGKVEPKREEMVVSKKGELNSENYKNVEVAPIWEDQYDGTEGFDTFNSVIETKDGGFIAVGETTILTDVILGDANIVKYDKNGQVEWQNALVGDDTEMFFDVKEDVDGNIFVIGKSHSSDLGFDNPANHSNGILTMYNKDGEEQWTASFSDNGIQIDYNDFVIVNDEIIVIGNKTNDGKKTGFIKTLDKKDGSSKSIEYYSDKKGTTRFNDILVNGKGDYVISGSVIKEDDSIEYPLVINVDKDTKKVEWSYSLSQNLAYKKRGAFTSLALDKDDNVYVSGVIKDGVNKSVIMKLNKTGVLEMIDVSKNTDWNEESKSVIVRGDEVFVTIEKTPKSSKYSYLKDIEMLLRGYNINGDVSFETKLSDDKNIRHMDTILTSDGDLLVAGRKYIEVVGDKLKCEVRNTEECVQADAYLLKVDYSDECEINNVPELNIPSDIINIDMGAKFDPMKGVTATDEGLDVTDKVVVNPKSIDTSVEGVHKITYSISDNCSTVEKEITINVIDRNPCKTNNLPVINVEDVVIDFGQEFDPMKGVTATDEGLDVTENIIVVKDNVNESKAGEYEVTYRVEDECGATEKTIKVTVKQNPCEVNKAPELNISNDVINLKIGDKFDPMKGVTATDEGLDVTDKVVVNPKSIDTSVEGVHKITYSISDNCSTVEKVVTVNVVNDDPCEVNNLPVINAEDVVIDFGQEFNPMKGVTATDEGKDVTEKIVVTKNEVDINKAGEYEVTYRVEDECGATEKTIKVTVKQNPCEVNNLPVINAEDIVIEVGQEFDPMKGVTATDEGLDVTEKIVVTKNEVDINKAGEYEVTYRVEDECGATEKTIKVTVNPIVEDMEDEVIPPVEEEKPNPPSEEKPNPPVESKPETEKPQTGDITFIYGILAVGATSGIYFVNRKKK